MIKNKLFVDFDQTISASIKSFCNVYNFMFQDHIDFKPARWWCVEKYNFSDECPLIANINNGVFNIFADPMFFEKLEFIGENTFDVLRRLNENYELHITSIGTFKNLSMKASWINDKLPFVKYAELLCVNKCAMNKSVVHMGDGSIFIDDVVSNLDSSNADFKIIFGDEYEWNKSDRYVRAINWTDVEKLLL